jgi:hypothetical protein
MADFACAAGIATGSLRETWKPGITSSPTSSTTTRNMHACSHSKKFISYKSHFAVDTKYLIMANEVLAAENGKSRLASAFFCRTQQNQ